MKKLTIKIISYSLLCIFLGLILLAKFYPISLLPIHPYVEINYGHYLLYSLIISVLIVILIAKKLDFLSVFIFMPLFIGIGILSFMFMNDNDFYKMDYFFSKKVNFQQKTFLDNGWTLNRFEVGEDYMVYAQNPSFDKIYTGSFQVYKSVLSQKYYVVKSTE